MTSPAGQIILDPKSRSWRRRLGPLPWAVLEELALSARLDEHGWVAAVGVRAIAVAVGVTKDTAARAVAALRTAGLVTADRVKTVDGRSLSAYRLELPDGITIHACSGLQDTNRGNVNGSCPKGDDTHCPDGEYSRRTPARQVNRSTSQSDLPDGLFPVRRRRRPRKRSGHIVQISLFDDPDPKTG